MACFIVPATEAIVTTAVMKVAETKRKEEPENHEETKEQTKPLILKQLKWLNGMLWGGAVLLCFEHIWHGEVVPWFPFLTAASNPADKAAMLHEMSTAGVSMAVLVTAVWVGMVIVTNVIAKRDVKASDTL